MNIKVYWFVSLFATLALVAVACSPTTATVSDEDPPQGAAASETDSEEAAGPATDIPVDAGSSAGATIDVPDDVELIEGGELPRSAEQEFETDFTRTTVLFSEILSGGPPKDGIPAVDDPQYISTSEADEWLEDVEPIALVEFNGQTRAFPIQILIWHEIVNAEVGGQPVSVTFCPLCNTAIAFNRELDNLVMDFGTTGRLRFSNLVMYDRQTETWWQQATGEAIIGEQVGKQLEYLPLSMISWQQYKDNYPNGEVLSRDTGNSRNYGTNPYVGYDNINRSPFLYIGPETPGELPAMARVLTVEIGEDAVAYPYSVMSDLSVVNDTIGGVDIVVLWQPGVASALDKATISASGDVGAVDVFSPVLNEQTLTFIFDNGEIKDEQTGSVWNVLGQAISGELAGEELEKIVAINHFWFSWAAFKPDTNVYTPES